MSIMSDCPICFESVPLGTFNCLHKCCVSCASKITKCPLCRKDIESVLCPEPYNIPYMRRPFEGISEIPLSIEFKKNWYGQCKRYNFNPNRIYVFAKYTDAKEVKIGYLDYTSIPAEIDPERLTYTFNVSTVGFPKICDINHKHIIIDAGQYGINRNMYYITNLNLSDRFSFIRRQANHHFTFDGDVLSWSDTMIISVKYVEGSWKINMITRENNKIFIDKYHCYLSHGKFIYESTDGIMFIVPSS